MFRIHSLLFLLLISLSSIAQKLPEEYYRAQAAIDNGDFELAIQWIDSAINISARNPLLWIKIGEAQFRTNNFDKAISSFKTADNYRNGIASYWLARTYAIQRDTANAFAELKRHLSSSSKEIEANILLDTAFSKIKDYPQWRKLWLNNWYSPNEILIADISYLFSRSEWEHALDMLNERMDGRNARHILYALRGEAYFNVGSFKAAEKDFAQALKKSRRNHNYMAWRAKALMAQNKNKKALRFLNQAIDQSGGEPHYYKIRAIAFASNLGYEKALEDIHYFLSFYPSEMDAIAKFAEYSMEAGKLIDALLQLGKLIKLDSTEPKYFNMRGKIYMKSSNWAMAEIDLDQSIKLDPYNADAFLDRGICRYNKGNTKSACSDWKEAIKLGSFKAQEYVYKNCR